MTAIAPGTLLAGKYRVAKVLGQGGMGVVVAAVHVQLDEPVALKFMLPEALGSPESVARFLREARAAVKLKSEHVARVSDVGTLESGAPYIVMELLKGTDLEGLLNNRGPLPPVEAVDYIIQACDALAEAHALGIVHRDLKPANLFVTSRRDGTPLVKVLDFGISKASPLNEQAGQGGESLTRTGGLMGSPVYMSPEQMKSAKDTDARADIWALGVILYELVGGRRPFAADTLGGLMAQVLTETPPPLATVKPGLPAALYSAVEKCLEKDRAKRWASIADFVLALEPLASPQARLLTQRIVGARAPAPVLEKTLIESSASSATSPVARTGPGPTAPGWAEESAARAPARSKRVGLGVAAAVVVALVVIGGIALRHGASPAPVTAIPSAPPSSPVGVPALAVATASAPLVTPEPSPPPPAAAPPIPAPTPNAPTHAAAPQVAATTSPPPPRGPSRKPPILAIAAPVSAAPSTSAPVPPAIPKPPKPPSDLFDTSN